MNWPLISFVQLAVLAAAFYALWRKDRNWRIELERVRQAATLAGQQSSQSLNREAARQEAFLNSLVEGLLLLDENGLVLRMSRSLERAFNLDARYRGHSLMEVFRLHELLDLVARAKVEGQVLACELDLPGRVARRFQVNATVLRDENQQPQGYVLTFHDVTRLKELEKTRQEFVANVSHELRTPLSIIKGNVETLLDGAKDDPAVSERFLRGILKHANRLAWLIDDLLTISRLESGKVALNIQEVFLGGLVSRAFEDLSARAAERQVRLLNEVPAGLATQADPDRLLQVLVNLLDNAIKYGDAQGEVRAGGRLSPQGEVEMWVADSGPGIPAEAQPRVFERFFRVDRARSRDQGGTGLGLAIVKHIVLSHGGKVWLESQPGRGSTFFFSLPAPGGHEG